MSQPLSSLDLHQPHVMGVLNVTPDSFSDGGAWYENGRLSVGRCRDRVLAMMAEGATLVDIGGESTRPGAAPVTVQQEMDRVLPVIEAIHDLDVVISVDTSSPDVMTEAARLGAGLLNDVRALQRPGALEAAAATGLPVCLMHMQGEPGTMQNQPGYGDVVAEVAAFLQARMTACEAAGINRERIVLDPGFGFGKTVAHNKQLLAGLETLAGLGRPLLVGLSRKSMIAHMLGDRDVSQRLAGSLALAVMAVERGACIVRAHDVGATLDAITIAHGVQIMGQ